MAPAVTDPECSFAQTSHLYCQESMVQLFSLHCPWLQINSKYGSLNTDKKRPTSLRCTCTSQSYTYALADTSSYIGYASSDIWLQNSSYVQTWGGDPPCLTQPHVAPTSQRSQTSLPGPPFVALVQTPAGFVLKSLPAYFAQSNNFPQKPSSRQLDGGGEG